MNLGKDKQMSKVILVTGGAGYIGSQFIRDLAIDDRFRGHTIRIYDNLQRNNYPVLMDLPANVHYQFVEGDILDRATLSDALKDVWAVIHLAAVVSTPISFEHPIWTYQINHWGTSMVVDEAIKAGVERFVYACSASVYGPGGMFHEADACMPVGPYSVSKLQGEQVVMEAGLHRNLCVTSLRLGNVFGDAPGIRFEAVGNRFAYLAGTGKSLVIHGDGEQKRPMIHVRDASDAIRFSLMNSATERKILNATSQNVSVNELVDAVKQTLPEATVRYTGQDALTALSFEVDNAELTKMGWIPGVSLKDGLAELVQRMSAFHVKE
jgi:UDP-glucose 4-epimerase